ncbi:MAG TPA: O-antigen ligase family protein [Pyrinomonadaceae bacterium]|nr:O-antigen ligase family protein [Pyrinomonadaceae bacterium]
MQVSSARSITARVISALVFYGLIILVCLAPIPYGSVEPWSQAVFECGVFVLGFGWCLHVMLKGPAAKIDLRLFLPLMAMVALALLQSVAWSRSTVAGVNVLTTLSADPFESRIFALRLGAVIVAGLIAARFTNNTTRLMFVANALIAVAVLSAIFGIARLTMQHADGFVLPSLRLTEGFGQFINKNHFAFLIEPSVGLLTAMILLRKDAEHQTLIYLSALILLWAALVMSKSRGGLLAVSLQMLVAALCFLYTRRTSTQVKSPRTRSIVTVVTSVVAIVIVVAGTTIWLGGDQLSSGVETAATEIASRRDDSHEGARRRDIWRATWQLARAHPFAGAGLGGYWAEIPAYHDASGILTPQQGHNDYLELLASGGLIGLGLFAWFLVALVQTTRKALATFTGVQRVLVFGAVIGIVGVGVHSLVDFGLHITCNALAFVMLLAVLSMSKIDQRRAAQAHRTATFN